MKVETTDIDGVVLMSPTVHGDDRGFFLETYGAAHHQALGAARFAQDMQSRSTRGVLRGLHYRVARPQGQLVTLLRGEAFDAVVDLRRGSPTFRAWTAVRLREDGVRQIYMPAGCAHGFLALSEVCDLHYKVTELYDAGDARTLKWDDADIGVEWPLEGMTPVISAADAAAPRFSELGADRLPRLPDRRA